MQMKLLFSCSYPIFRHVDQDDLQPFIRELLLYHPGLEFLEAHPDFHPKYATTVTTRIFYIVNTRCHPGALRAGDVVLLHLAPVTASVAPGLECRIFWEIFLPYSSFIVVERNYFAINQVLVLFQDATESETNRCNFAAPSRSGRISQTELRRSNLVEVFNTVDEEEDINKVVELLQSFRRYPRAKARLGLHQLSSQVPTLYEFCSRE